MSYAMSTVGQGGSVYLTVPLCSINAGTNTDISGIEFDIQPLTGNSAGFFNIAGVSGSNVTVLRIEVATGILQWRYSGTVYLSSAAGVAPMNERARYGAEWDESNSSLYLTKNGERIAGPYVASSALHTNIAWSQIGRVGTSSPSPQAFELYGVRTYGGNATYQAQWDETGASGTGGNWADDTATRNITITGHTGAADSWWLFYSDVEEHFGTFTAAASIARALSSEKQGLGLYASSMVTSSSWTVEPSSYGSFSTSYTVNRSLVSSKEVSLTKPNQSLVAGKTFTQSKETSVSKPNQSLFTGTSLTQSKQAIVNKPTQSLLAATVFTQAKEVNVAKPTTFLHENSAFTWEIFYGVGGTFASVMQLTKTLASNKESSSTLSGSLLATGSVNSSKEIATAFNSGMQTGFSGISSEKQTLANIYAEMVSGFSITSSKESGSYFARTMRIDDRFSGGTDEAGRPRVITYSTNVLSKRSYQTSATITRIV